MTGKTLRALTLGLALLTPNLAWGQLATDLVCTPPGCVNTGDIADGAVTGNKLGNGSILTGKYADQSVTGNKLAQGSILAGKLANGAVRTGKIADGAVTFVKLEDSVQIRVEDLEQQLADILNPPACTAQTMDGDWQAYSVHSPGDMGDAAGTTSCALTIASGGTSVTGSCVDERGNIGDVIPSGSSFTVATTCDVTAHLEFDPSFGNVDITDAVLDRSRNVLTGVGTNAVVGALMTTAARR